jgi:NHL repeat
MWIVDAGVVENVKGNQIFKYSPSGELLMTLGKPGVRGTTPDLFNEPSDLAIAPNGDLYIADGHINVESNRQDSGKYLYCDANPRRMRLLIMDELSTAAVEKRQSGDVGSVISVGLWRANPEKHPTYPSS